MTFYMLWLVPAFISFLFTAILVYKENPIFRRKGELLGAILMSCVPVVNIAVVFATGFALFEKYIERFGDWLDSPVHGTDGKDW